MSVNTMDFTKLMGNVYSELDVEFKTMHTNEELKQRLNALKNKIDSNKNDGEELLDSAVIALYTNLTRMLKECIADFTIPDNYDLTTIGRSVRAETSKLKRTDNNYVEKLKEINTALENQIADCCNYISDSISSIPSMEDFDEMFMEKIADKYLSENVPASVDYITRIVHRRLRKISPEFVCIKGEIGAKTDSEGYAIDENGYRILKESLPSAKLLILKQFIKVFGWGEGVADTDEGRRGQPICSKELKEYIDNNYGGSKEKAAIDIDESIFSQFEKSGHRGLFLIAERLGDGKFNPSQFVREDIYIFSIAFKMTFSSELRSNIAEGNNDYETDIRKNLFFDYYCENLFNFNLNKKVTVKKEDDTKNSERNNRRKYIPGYGPNYRNFVEMIYIYFIERKDLNELEKLQNAKKMIKDCQKEGRKSDVFAETDDDDSLYYKPTEYFRTTVFADIKNKKDDEFKKYILENFVCGVENLIEYNEKNKQYCEIERTISRMNMNAAHITSADIYSELLLSYEQEMHSIHPEKKKTVISYTGDNNRLYNLLERFNDLCENERVLRKWYLSLSNAYNHTQLRDGMLEYDDNFVVNRTDLEVLLTDYAVIKFSEISIDKQKEISSNFKSFYDYLSKEMLFNISGNEYSGISSVLIDCGYQEICSKNIFDIMIIYLTYKKICCK